MAEENVFIKFEVDYQQLDAAIATLEKTGKLDPKVAQSFQQTQKAITGTATDTKGLIKQFKDVATASVKMGKSVENAFGSGVQDALDEAGVSVKEFGDALKKANAPAITLKKELMQLKESMARMKAEGKDTGKEFDSLRARAGKLSDAIADANAEIKNAGSDTRGIDNVVGSISALAGGYAAVQGAAALFGDENEDLQRALLKVNSAMAIATGTQQLMTAVQKEGSLARLADVAATGAQSAAMRIYTFVTEGSTVATKIFRAALVATGIGAVVLLLISAYQAMQSFGDNTKETTKEIDKFSLAIDASKDSLDRFISSQSNASDIAIEKAKQRGATEAEINKLVIKGLKDNASETEKVLKGSLGRLNTFAKQVGDNIGVNLGANAFQEFQGRLANARDILIQISNLKISGEFDKLSSSAQASVNSLEQAANKVNELSLAAQKLTTDATLKQEQALTKAAEERFKKQQEFRDKQRKALEDALKEAARQENEAAKNSIQLALDRDAKLYDQEFIAFNNRADLQAEEYDNKKKLAAEWDTLWKQFQESLTKSSEIESGKRKKLTEEEKQAMITTIQTIVTFAEKIGSIFNELSSQRTARDNAEIDLIRKRTQEELAAGRITQKEADARFKQLEAKERSARQQQAKREKAAAVFSAVLAIPKAFLQGLSQSGLPLAIAYAALAAIEAGIIASRPVPRFKGGKKDGYEGPGIVGDAGSELVERNGRMFLYTKPTQTYLGAKDKVYTASETRNIMHNTNISTVARGTSAPVFDYDRFAKAIPAAGININIDKDGITEWGANKLQRTKYMDKRYSSK